MCGTDMVDAEQIRHATRGREIGLVLGLDYRSLPFVLLDLSAGNELLRRIDIADAAAFGNYILDCIAQQRKPFAIGAYDEDRVIYDHSSLFAGQTPRTIHLGIDLWVPPGTAVLAPLDATVHGFANNTARGDYGPTIILQHDIDGVTFFTLYGHLSVASLQGLQVGQRMHQGQRIGSIGSPPTNGNWPPHLHFQLITDMLGRQGDFFGVAPRDRREEFLALCPDPNILLRIPGL